VTFCATLKIKRKLQKERVMNAIPGKTAFVEAVTKPAPKAEIISLEDKKLLRDNPELVARAKEIGSGLNPKATIQYIKQSLALAEAVKEREAAGLKPLNLSVKHQKVVQPTRTARRQMETADGGGVAGMFSSAFLHIPATSPYRPK